MQEVPDQNQMELKAALLEVLHPAGHLVQSQEEKVLHTAVIQTIHLPNHLLHQINQTDIDKHGAS